MGRGAEPVTPPCSAVQCDRHKGRLLWRLYKQQPVTDQEGVDSESHPQVCYYRSDVRGLECDLKGLNETLSINTLTASSNKSKSNPILKKSVLSGHE